MRWRRWRCKRTETHRGNDFPDDDDVISRNIARDVREKRRWKVNDFSNRQIIAQTELEKSSEDFVERPVADRLQQRRRPSYRLVGSVPLAAAKL